MATERPNTCTYDPCDSPILAKGLCAGHYGQKRRGKDLAPKRDYLRLYNGQECPVALCSEAQASNGLCWGHASLARNRQMETEEFVRVYVEPVRHRATEVISA